MQPVDPRLLRHAGAARGYLVLTIGLGLVMTALILAQAACWRAHWPMRRAALACRPVRRAASAAGGGRSPGRRGLRRGGGGAAGGRAGEVTATARARRAFAAARTGLARRPARGRDHHAGHPGPGRTGCLLRPLPAAACARGAGASRRAGRVAAADWISAVIIAVTLPLIPLFAVLVGWHTSARTRRQWRLLAALGGHFLDVVEGLPTLKVFGRAKAQAQVIDGSPASTGPRPWPRCGWPSCPPWCWNWPPRSPPRWSRSKWACGCWPAISAMRPRCWCCLLTPEAYLPLRAVSAQFHASNEGAAAAGRVFEILDTPAERPPLRPAGPGRAVRRADLRTDAISAERGHRGLSRPGTPGA